jgi:hypothetical protein
MNGNHEVVKNALTFGVLSLLLRPSGNFHVRHQSKLWGSWLMTWLSWRFAYYASASVQLC